MMAKGDIYFEDINKAWDYILQLEKTALYSDEFRKPPLITLYPPGIGYKVEPTIAYHNDFPEDAFIVNRVASRDGRPIRYSLKPNMRHRKFLFRGQSKFYSPCTPSLFRESKLNYIGDILLVDEMSLLIKNHPLSKLLDRGVMLEGINFIFEMNTPGLAQHYYNKTPFIDLTSDIDAASFFATTTYNGHTDTYTPVTDSEDYGVLYYMDVDSQWGFQDFKGCQLSTIGLQIFPRSGVQRGFLQKMLIRQDFNNLPNVHWVYFKHNKAIAENIFVKMDGGKKLFPSDILERHWRNRPNPMVVSKEALALNHQKNKQTPIFLLKKQAMDFGFQIKKYMPSFTPAELDEYYQDIKNGFWEEFCNKIYFAGKNGEKLKTAFLNIPNREEYKWAFLKKQ